MKCSDEISIGEYVRTDNGIIGKYVKYRGWQDTIETNNKWIGFDINKDIVKHSKNIIDLVEEGDYVNGYKVLYVCNEEPCPSGKYVDIDLTTPEKLYDYLVKEKKKNEES